MTGSRKRPVPKKAVPSKKVLAKKTPAPQGPGNFTAREFERRLRLHQSDLELEKIKRYFKSEQGEYGHGDTFIGVRMGQVFALAKEFIEMDIQEIERLLENQIHELRAGALSIMDKQARSKKTTPAQRKELFELYLRRIDRINNWDLVDVSCQYVIGGYLEDKPRKILLRLAKSSNVWERRTAIVSTAYFIRRGDLDDCFAISEILLSDKHDLIHKAVGWMLRFTGDKDKKRLVSFIERHAGKMPRTMLRAATEKLDKKQRDRLMQVQTF